LAQAGVVHNDVKPDNLIWTDFGSVSHVSNTGGADEGAGCGLAIAVVPNAKVRIVDFGCARLDSWEDNGRNWSLAEGGAGHLGKWSPEMTLRLHITHKNDVWGLAISLCELHSSRAVWRSEADTAEVVLAQCLGLCGHMEGMPLSLLRRSPLDITQLYTPGPSFFPVRRLTDGTLEALRPCKYGLDQVLGKGWHTGPKSEFGKLLNAMLVADPECRPSASVLLETVKFVAVEKSPPSQNM